MEIRISGIVDESIVDGKGFRYVVFTQGCYHNCEGCHNPETHDINGGRVVDTEKLFEEFCENPLLKGITFSGGEPFLQPEPLSELAKQVHQIGKNVWCYSGFTYEELMQMNNPSVTSLLENIDVLVDGKFILSEKNLELLFRGSNNQRLIDMNKTRENNSVTLLETDE